MFGKAEYLVLLLGGVGFNGSKICSYQILYYLSPLDYL